MTRCPLRRCGKKPICLTSAIDNADKSGTLTHNSLAEVAELADALRSGRSSLRGVWVRLPPSAHMQALLQVMAGGFNPV